MRYSPLVERVGGDGADAWRVHALGRVAEARGERVYFLSVGDPDLDPPPEVLERAIECMRAGDTHYTPAGGRDHLRTAIAAAHRARSGQAVGPENVIFLAGAQNGLFTAAMCLLAPGDEVIALEPLYPTYPATLEATGARLVRVGSPSARGFRVDLAALESAITPKTRAIFFATPNNPSGVILSEADLEAIGALARRHSLWIVADEVYAGLAPGGRVPGLAAALPDRVVTVSSLSKSHAMPGWRAGWLVGPEALVTHAEALAQCMLYGLPGFIQEAAVAALAVAERAEARIRDYCASRRDLVIEALSGTPGLHCHLPDAGMFMLIDVGGTGLSGEEFMCGLFEAERVSVLDGGAFGRETSACVRVCFAAVETVLRESMVRIRRYAGSLMNRSRGGHVAGG